MLTKKALISVFFLPLLVSCAAADARPNASRNSKPPESNAQAQADTAAAPPIESAPAGADAPQPEQTGESVAKTSATPEATSTKLAQQAKPLDPKDPRSVIYLGRDGKPAGTGDPKQAVSDAFKFGKGASAAALTAPTLPKDKFGLVDWIAVTDKELIQPVGTLDPSGSDDPPFDMSVVVKAKGDFVKDVLFQHKTHTYWLKCENCHTGIFQMAAGQNNMSMAGISQGKWCGRCHGKVSFPLTDCNRCHSQPKPATKAAP